MKQPTKDILREQLALAADEIIRLRVSLEAAWGCYTNLADLHEALLANDLAGIRQRMTRRWWHRFAWWRK